MLPTYVVIPIRPTPLKTDEVEKIFYGLHKKIAVAVHIHTYLSTSAHPVAQSRGGRTREALGPVAAQ